MNAAELRKYLIEKTGKKWRRLKRASKEIRRNPANALAISGITIAIIYGNLGYELSKEQLNLSKRQDSTATKIDSFNTLLSQVKVLLDKQNRLIEISSAQTTILSRVSTHVKDVARYGMISDSVRKESDLKEYALHIDRIYLMYKNLYHLFNQRFVSYSLSISGDRFKSALVREKWLQEVKKSIEPEFRNPIIMRNRGLIRSYFSLCNSVDEELTKTIFYTQNNRDMPLDKDFEACVKKVKEFAEKANDGIEY